MLKSLCGLKSRGVPRFFGDYSLKDGKKCIILPFKSAGGGYGLCRLSFGIYKVIDNRHLTKK